MKKPKIIIMPACKEDYVDQTSQPMSFLKSETRGDWSMYDWRGDFQKDGNYNWHLSYQGKLPIKIEGRWRSHCTDARLGKECIEIKGVV